MYDDRMQAGIAEQDLPKTFRRRVTLENGLDIFADASKHYLHLLYIIFHPLLKSCLQKRG